MIHVRLALLALLLGSHFCSFAQRDRSRYTLLWKISSGAAPGKMLRQPSYLFGTMHLKDKRVFEFSDSVLVKLHECQAFAMELHPDSVMRELFAEIVKQGNDKTENRFRRALSEKEYEELDEQLQKEAGVSLERLKNKSPQLIRMLISKSKAERQDKPTFLDAHMYYLARLQGKQIIGLEYLREQLGDSDSLTVQQQLAEIKEELNQTSRKNALEKLIGLYYAGNSDQLYQYVGEGIGGKELAQLVKRNRTMADRLEKIMREKSTFVAVGAAHLGGEAGLVQLLRNMGYTVTPVAATFTGMAGRYVVDSKRDTWQTFTPAKASYSIDMPSQPHLYEYKRDVGFSMYVYPDLGTGMVYNTMQMAIPTKADAQFRERLLQEMVQDMVKRKGVKVLSEKKIETEGSQGREVQMFSLKEGNQYRIRVYLRGSQLYFISAGGPPESQVYGDADRFFNSLRLLAPSVDTWREFVSAEGAFRVEGPGEFRQSVSDTPDENGMVTKIHSYVTASQSDGTAFVVACIEFPAGNVVTSDSLYLQTVADNLISRFKAKVMEDKSAPMMGYPARSVTLEIPDKGMVYRSSIILRDNRPTMVTAVYGVDKSGEDAERFFRSFAFESYPKTDWRSYSPADQSFTVQLPAEPVVEVDSAQWTMVDYYQRKSEYATSDPASGLPFTVLKYNFDPYYHVKSEDELFANLLRKMRNDGDTVLSSRKLTVNGFTGREYVVRDPGNHLLLRVRWVLRGLELYQMVAYLPERELNGALATTFFGSLQLPALQEKVSVFEPKAGQLLRQLTALPTGADSTARKQAVNGLRIYNFDSGDLPLLYEALRRTYPDDTGTYSGTRERLIRAVRPVADSTTIRFFRDWYPTLTNLPDLQNEVLVSLGKMRTPASLALFRELLLTKTPLKASYSVLFTLDTLPQVRELFPDITRLQHNAEWQDLLYKFVLRARDSSWVKPDAYASIGPGLVTDLQQTLAKRTKPLKKGDYDEGEYRVVYRVQLLADFTKDPACLPLLQGFLTDRSTYVALTAARILLEQKLPFDKRKLERIAADPSTRLGLYTALTEKGQQALFPAKYFSQSSFAESALQAYLEDGEDFYPDGMELVSGREVNFQEKQGIAYLFKVRSQDENGKSVWYPAIVGLFPLDKKKVERDDTLMNIDYEDFSKKKTDEHFRYFLEPRSDEPDED